MRNDPRPGYLELRDTPLGQPTRQEVDDLWMAIHRLDQDLSVWRWVNLLMVVAFTLAITAVAR